MKMNRALSHDALSRGGATKSICFAGGNRCPFAEALLVANLAARLQQRIERVSANLRAKNAPEAEALVRKKYRSGFGIS